MGEKIKSDARNFDERLLGLLSTAHRDPKQDRVTATSNGRDRVSLKFDAKNTDIKMKVDGNYLTGRYNADFDLVVTQKRVYMAINTKIHDMYFGNTNADWDDFKRNKGVLLYMTLDDKLTVRGGYTASISSVGWASVLEGERIRARIHDTNRVALTISRHEREPRAPRAPAPLSRARHTGLPPLERNFRPAPPTKAPEGRRRPKQEARRVVSRATNVPPLAPPASSRPPTRKSQGRPESRHSSTRPAQAVRPPSGAHASPFRPDSRRSARAGQSGAVPSQGVPPKPETRSPAPPKAPKPTILRPRNQQLEPIIMTELSPAAKALLAPIGGSKRKKPAVSKRAPRPKSR